MGNIFLECYFELNSFVTRVILGTRPSLCLSPRARVTYAKNLSTRFFSFLSNNSSNQVRLKHVSEHRQRLFPSSSRATSAKVKRRIDGQFLEKHTVSRTFLAEISFTEYQKEYVEDEEESWSKKSRIE